MNTLNATLRLFADVSSRASRGFVQSLWALGVLCVGAIALALANPLFFDPLGGMMAGVGRALLADAFVAAWLSLLGVWVLAQRAVLFRHIRLHATAQFWPVVQVTFVFFALSFIASLTGVQQAWWLLVVVACVANPVPEVLIQQRTDGLNAFTAAVEFMQANWPEWLAAQVIPVTFAALWSFAFTGDVGPQDLATVWLDLGPKLTPLDGAAPLVTSSADSGAAPPLVGAVVLLLFTHWWFLFRGHLFHSLSQGNRRLRAWQARM